MDNLGKEDSETGPAFLEELIWLVWRASWENKSRWWGGYLEMAVAMIRQLQLSTSGAGSPYFRKGLTYSIAVKYRRKRSPAQTVEVFLSFVQFPENRQQTNFSLRTNCQKGL